MYNRHEIVGNVGADPEIKQLQSGSTVATFSVAVTKKFHHQGERREETTWFRVACFGPIVEKLIEPYVHKGTKVFVAGEGVLRQYESDGVKKTAYEINASSGTVLLLGDGNRSQGQSRPAQRPADDEIPF